MRLMSALFLLFALTLPGCKKKPAPLFNKPGQVSLQKDQRWFLGHPVGREMTLEFTVFDPDGIANVAVHGIARTFFTKKYPTACGRLSTNCKGPVAKTRDRLRVKLDLSEWTDGKHVLSLEVEDLEGEVTKQKVPVICDITEPEIQIHSPLNLSTLKGNTNVVFSVTDKSRLREVRLLDNDSLLKIWSGNSVLFLKQTSKKAPIYTYPLQFTSLAPGTHRLELRAEDQVGNKSSEVVTVVVNSRGEGALCRNDQQCVGGLRCVRQKLEPQPRCRKRCRYTSQCPSNHRCRKLGRDRLCVPVMRRFQNKAFGLCNQNYPCSERFICARIGLQKPRCYPRCGGRYPRCPAKTVCRRFQKTRLCAKPVKRVDKGLEEGKECSSTNVCKRHLVCARFQGATPRCRRKCKASGDCRKGERCWKGNTKGPGLCYKPSDMVVTKVARYGRCGGAKPCQAGLVCVGVQNGQKHCQKSCKKQRDCDELERCVPAGLVSLCARTCNPNSTSSCRSGMRCRFVPDLKNMVSYVCL